MGRRLKNRNTRLSTDPNKQYIWGQIQRTKETNRKVLITVRLFKVLMQPHLLAFESVSLYAASSGKKK